MAHGPRFRVARRRRREGKTDFRTRINLLRSDRPRAVVRKSHRNIIVQLIEFDPSGDRVIAASEAFDLRKHGWKGSTSNTPAAYLTGYLAGKKAISAGITGAVLDIGLSAPTKGGRVFATLKGLVDAGLDIPYSEDVVPSEERIRGEHIGDDVKSQFETVRAEIEGAK